jgi:hypothetical protein
MLASNPIGTLEAYQLRAAAEHQAVITKIKISR